MFSGDAKIPNPGYQKVRTPDLMAILANEKVAEQLRHLRDVKFEGRESARIVEQTDWLTGKSSVSIAIGGLIVHQCDSREQAEEILRMM